MDLLARLVGADAARQFRERVTAPASRVAPAPVRPGTGTPGRSDVRSAPAPSSVAAPAALQDPLALASLDAGDFPTSILATAAIPAPPLLAAFANGPALRAAILFAEALAPPVALRDNLSARASVYGEE